MAGYSNLLLKEKLMKDLYLTMLFVLDFICVYMYIEKSLEECL